MKYIICDLDGTLCDASHREHLINESWDAFHAAHTKDSVVLPTLQFLERMLKLRDWSEVAEPCYVIFLTGRNEAYRASTIDWLNDECGLAIHDDYEALLMRPDYDYTPDHELKPQMLSAFMASFVDGETPKESVLVLDDRDKVVAAWRDAGYTCWQVKEGSY